MRTAMLQLRWVKKSVLKKEYFCKHKSEDAAQLTWRGQLFCLDFEQRQ